MYFTHQLIESFTAVRANPLRSALSILGVIFGVASVIAMLGIGLGASKQIDQLISSLGAQTVHIISKELSENEWSKVIASSQGISDRDVSLIQELIPAAKVAPISKWSISNINQELTGPKLDLFAVNSTFAGIMASNIIAGRFFTNFENNLANPIVIIGKDLALKWFDNSVDKAIFKEIRIERKWFTIVGVMQSAKINSSESTKQNNNTAENDGMEIKGLDLNNSMLIPLNSGMRRFGKPATINLYDRIVVQLPDNLDPLSAKELLLLSLNKLHRNAQVFDITAAEEILQQKKKASQLFTGFLLLTALISLLVGGIGIANVMLASVAERIKEVGLRRAIGAKKRHIRMQFLMESLIICCMGGILGGFLGAIVCYLIQFKTGWEVVFPWWGLFISLFIATIVGLLSGIYPAVMASKISPIEALQGRA